MYKKLLIPCLLLLFVLLSTTNSNNIIINDDQRHELIFTGENYRWVGEFKVIWNGEYIQDNIVCSKDIHETLSIKYKGKKADILSIQKLVFSFKSKTSSAKREYANKQLNQEYYIIESSAMNAQVKSEDEIIVVDINLDGNKETFTLKKI